MAQNDKVEVKKAPIDTIFAQGEVNPYGKFFTGMSYLNMLNPNDEVFNCPIGSVTFEPGCRTNVHIHDGGQILLVLAGRGLYCEVGSAPREIKAGDIVRIPPHVKHWHGAAPDSWMIHISIEPNMPNNKATWLEPVSDEDYLTKPE